MAALIPATAHAFLFPEHRDVGVRALEQLTLPERAALDSLWQTARPTFLGPVCATPTAGATDARCVDFAALAAIAGDHSCSPHDVIQDVLPGGWILDVERVAAETKTALARAHSPEAIYNRMATMHLQMQAVDPEYLSRAGANNAHFLLAREHDALGDYLQEAVQQGAPLNALGLYLQYHLAALQRAHALGKNRSDGTPRAALARDVIALESFAWHWLEDMFAAGHAVGTWGADAWRKGTHDFYNEHGYDTTTWGGSRIVAFGDGNMQRADRDRAALPIHASLAQVLAALDPNDALSEAIASFGPGGDTMLHSTRAGAPSNPRPTWIWCAVSPS